jgi:hypothetical protein
MAINDATRTEVKVSLAKIDADGKRPSRKGKIKKIATHRPVRNKS